MRRFVLLAMLAFASNSGHAQGVADVEDAWRGWMTRHGQTSGGLVVLRAGKLVHEAVLGRALPEAPVPLASLSKAVTGVCVAHLVERGQMSFETPLSRLLPRTLARVGPPADARLLQATLGQLLSHRAGFGRAQGDPTTGAAFANHLRSATARDTAFDAQLKWTLQRPLQWKPGERYEYTNSAYLILGAIVEEATRRDYESFCREAVLVPLGVRTAMLDPAWRILASYGGWRMTLADYGRFYQAFADGKPAIGPKARTWMMSPDGKSIATGAHYGLGTNVRPFRDRSANFWHWGSWTYMANDAYDGPLRASYATFAARWGGVDAGVVTYIEPRPDEGTGRSELDRALSAAVGAVKRWPRPL